MQEELGGWLCWKMRLNTTKGHTQLVFFFFDAADDSFKTVGGAGIVFPCFGARDEIDQHSSSSWYSMHTKRMPVGVGSDSGSYE